MIARRRSSPALPPVRPLETRPLLGPRQAGPLARLFKVFASETRLRLLHALVRKRELRVTDLANEVGMKPQAVSNQLQRLVDRGIVASARSGSSVCYRIVDPCVRVLLERGLCLIECWPEPKECAENGGSCNGRE